MPPGRKGDKGSLRSPPAHYVRHLPINEAHTKLFSEFHLESGSLRNRIVISPMCQYSAEEGVPNDWHLVHLGARAIGGAALVIAEATAVSPEGRITAGCTGLWNDRRAEAWAHIPRFVKRHGAVPGIQIAHAGRKASANRPWDGGPSMRTG
jgi:2,4-dienoyl-CoA reductase-like NADH-dependent reductase (Old Yellow Enzyme family)